MYSKTGIIVVSEELQEKIDSKTQESQLDLQAEHHRWREYQGNRKCKKVSEKSYWQVKSHCARL